MVSCESKVLPLALGIPSDDVADKQGRQGAARDFEDDAEGDAKELQLLSEGDTLSPLSLESEPSK